MPHVSPAVVTDALLGTRRIALHFFPAIFTFTAKIAQIPRFIYDPQINAMLLILRKCYRAFAEYYVL